MTLKGKPKMCDPDTWQHASDQAREPTAWVFSFAGWPAVVCVQARYLEREKQGLVKLDRKTGQPLDRESRMILHHMAQLSKPLMHDEEEQKVGWLGRASGQGRCVWEGGGEGRGRGGHMGGWLWLGWPCVGQHLLAATAGEGAHQKLVAAVLCWLACWACTWMRISRKMARGRALLVSREGQLCS
jgi:hypothetical protein